MTAPVRRGYAALGSAFLLVSVAVTSAFTGPAFLSNSLGKTSFTSLDPTKSVQCEQSTLRMATVADSETKESKTGGDALAEYVKARGGNRVIRKILIANNGMAATKSILSMRQWAYMELGDEKAIQFVAMATPEDLRANAEFIRLADSFVEVPGGKNLNNYANVDVICKIAQEQGVDAVWPGWGHASENPKLPYTLTDMGIKFIGPTGPVMSVLGDKIAANILAQTAGVPSIPWSGSFGGPDDGPLQAELTEEGTIPDETFEKGTCRNVEEAVEAARKIGYEFGVMIKASEGGGGKGIRLVYNEDELRTAYPQVESEVIGSPIFIMQLCNNARHLEVQIVGDEHGNAVALNGRDCSTQRRFQKIFEEAPPAIAPRETFRKMEKAAQRLTQNIGYIGAGTVEFLYNADTGKFFFLELNPRLQVEHPVTEGITEVNLPATQLQVAMGIPLYNVPQVRRLYDRDMYGLDRIDFLEGDYHPINTHVIAARITAENPDEGFKPTAGSIERIKFQSTSNVWGYFSVGANGGIHEFADSQFGHLFAKGPTREQARKALVLALKEIEVRGNIRTTVEYLVQLLETDAFKENTIDTAWLDGILKEKSVKVEVPPDLVVVSAAVFKAFEHVKDETENVKEYFSKGQVGTGGVPSINSFNIEIPYMDTKYPFHVERIASDIYRLTLDGYSVDVRVTVTAEGALLANFGGAMHRIIGMEEPLGLRLSVDGVTILMPKIYDPSELRTDVTGKVVRYLQENGADVEAGEPYVEVEAMKMIMPIKASESGKITHALSPGTVISAGDLLASLALKDPSKVKQIRTFTGALDIETAPLDFTPKENLMHILEGFNNDPEAVTATAVAECKDIESATDLVVSALDEFVRVESEFDDKLLDDVVRDLIKANTDSLETVIDLINAHQGLQMRMKAVGALLRFVEEFPSNYAVTELSPELEAALERVTKLKNKEYGEVKLAASNIIRESKVPPFEQRLDELRSTLKDDSTDLDELSRSAGLSAGVDMLTELIKDDDKDVRFAAIEVYVKRVYRTYRIADMKVDEIDGRLTCSWTFQFADVPVKESVARHGILEVVPKISSVDKLLPQILKDSSEAFGQTTSSTDGSVNVLHLMALEDDSDNAIGSLEDALSSQVREMKMLGVRSVTVLIPVRNGSPTYYTFPECDDFKEDPIRRNMRPTFHHLLELSRLSENFTLERLDAVGKNAQVYIGTEPPKPGRRVSSQVVFVRGISHTPGLVSYSGARRSMLQGLDELERAQSNSKVSASSSSRIFLHSLPELEGTTSEEVAIEFADVMSRLKSRLAQRLLKLRVDEIEVKVRISSKDENGEPIITPVRLIASSMEGEWLKPIAYEERPDPVTGVTREFCVLGDGDKVCFLDPYGASNLVQTKRAIARRVGSTYAYDFLGLMEVALIGEWEAYSRSFTKIGAETPESMPTGIFQAQELVTQPDGSMAPGSRVIGSNTVGMLAWQVTMKTPEYPEGRDVVVIANDVTVQSGSFGVQEDDVYFKASEYAREHKLPRVYIACNAGARIGLVDELKPKFKIKFSDENNPTKGFEYLYLSDEDYAELPEGTVNAHKVSEGWAIDDIIGTKHGIGVENLQGSGMIAGETSRAYDEIFTLSYITGRSVGIGAYLVRLGQRIIQMTQGPMLLTGYSALNKLLGREVYTSQDQLGGPQVMVPNGVTHEQVDDDQQGVASILKWLSFVPKHVGALPASREAADPIEREVTWRPTTTPYDPRLMMTGEGSRQGFFDDGSWKEYLAGWGKSVVVGRARLGGIPMGVVAVETRLVDKVVPADPADPNSREAILPQAGQVLYPDSSYKFAQAVNDYKNEGLPIMIFANWRGFSGGSRDMSGEIMKYGSMIVDALREYEHPVFIYLPPHSELRGGSWVVIDPKINEEKMEMYADPDSRGGILEPAGIIEVKFREPDQLKAMHRLDPQLQLLDAELEMSELDEDAQNEIKKQIKAREDLLKPVYTQAATEFADLHDKTGRMKAKGVIKAAVPWSNAREFFYYLATRRIQQDDLVAQLKKADGSINTSSAVEILKSMCNADWEDNKAVVDFFENEAATIDAKIKSVKKTAIQAQLKALNAEIESMN